MGTVIKLKNAAELPVVTNNDQHNQVYKHGANLISPNMQLLDRHSKINSKVKRDLTEGIVCMKAVTDYDPNNWAAFWVMGKAQEALGEHKLAYESFKASFDIQKESPDVAREYARSCLELGLGEEAIRATKHAISLSPNDAGLQANMALACLFTGKNEEAKVAISKSLDMDPDDKISQTARKIVDEVSAGKRHQPKNMQDLKKR